MSATRVTKLPGADFLRAGAVFLGLLSGCCAHAQWNSDTSASLRVCISETSQTNPWIAPDGAGGTVVVWEDGRAGGSDLYAQRIDGAGMRIWAPEGVAVNSLTTDQGRPKIVACGDGTTIIAWRDDRIQNAVYAQRLSASGSRLWAANGVQVSPAMFSLSEPKMVADGSGGAIVFWEHSPPDTIYAQRLRSDGTLQWPAGGVLVSTQPAGSGAMYIEITEDGSGGAYLTWDSLDYGNVYLQHVDANGQLQYGVNGLAQCTASSKQARPCVVSDGNGGVITSWSDGRSTATTGWDRYAQRLDSTGTLLWDPQGAVLCDVVDWKQSYPPVYWSRLATDGAGGAFASWNDNRNGAFEDVYVQRLSSSGTRNWSPVGIALSATSDLYERDAYPVPDGQGGAVITWISGVASSKYYAQRVSSSGVVQWAAGGVPVATAVAGYKGDHYTITDGASGAYLLWRQYSTTNFSDGRIYLARIFANGSLIPAAGVDDWMVY